MRAEALKGHLDGLVLAVLEAGPLHGYAVIEALRVRSAGTVDLPTGTIYPALHRLERAGLLRSDWVQALGRRRRVYSLTGAGRAALTQERGRWDDFVRAVGGILAPLPSLGGHAVT